MTEQEWLACDDLQRMLWLFRNLYQPDTDCTKPVISERKLQLCDDALIENLDMNTPALQGARLSPSSAQLAAALLRDIVGNPWRPATLPQRYVQDCPLNCLVGGKGLESSSKTRCGGCGTDWKPYHPWLSWNDGVVRKMAQSIYDDRRFDELPMLADALEEAGCDDEVLLQHLRGWERCPRCFQYDEVFIRDCGCDRCGYQAWLPLHALHVRGCWALDLLLGRE